MLMAMVLDDNWRSELSTALGAGVKSERPISGGDISEAREVELADGRCVFVKFNHRAPPRFFEAEAEGLEFLRVGLAKAPRMRVPEVLHVGEQILVLEFLKLTKHGAPEVLGEGLAALHRSKADSWGGPRANFIGALGQLNQTRSTWAEFFIKERLLVQLSLPGAKRLLNPGVRRGFDSLFEALPDLLRTNDPPSRLHGDLWSGNYSYIDGGAALFDPAVYVGHREVDLAMMRLFGGFDSRVFEAYEAAYPLAPGSEKRMKIYQLYPLLVHVNLFGASYVSAVEASLRALTAR
jgi:protein-ribulosamine 3-kinase